MTLKEDDIDGTLGYQGQFVCPLALHSPYQVRRKLVGADSNGNNGQLLSSNPM